MVYEIYIDILICTNIFINYFVLLALSKIFNIDFKKYRLILASFLGGIYSFLIFLPDNLFFIGLILKFLASLSIILLAFKISSFLNFIKINYSVFLHNKLHICRNYFILLVLSRHAKYFCEK